MKKLIVLILSAALLCTASVAASAASPITSVATGENSDTAPVKGTYVPGSAAETVYHVDITWGSMEFTYTDASQGRWNPETHEYDGSVEAGWSCDAGADTITVTNHSNAGIKATFAYAAAEGFSAVSGRFDKTEITLDSAVGTAVANAPKDTAVLSLTGALPKNTSGVKIGTVTVTLKSGE